MHIAQFALRRLEMHAFPLLNVDLHHKKRWFLTYFFNKDIFVTKTEQDCGDFSMDIFCPQRATPSTVATYWIFFTGRRLDLKNDLPLFVVIFCHSELHQYVWGNSQMPPMERNNALWKCLFFFCCLFRQWLVYSCYWGPKTNIDRSNNAYSKYARFGARRGLLAEVCVEVLNLAILNLSRKYIFKKL